jgi:hypothetical protein
MPNDPHRGIGPVPAASLAFAAALLVAAPALADSDNDFDKKPDDIIAADKQAKDEKGAKMPGEKDKAPEGDGKPDPKYDPLEESGKPYYFIGLRFRDVIVPKFMINIFASGGASVNVAMVGPEFTRRKNGIETDFAIQYADYSMNPFMFKGKSDGDEAYEIVSSSMKMMLFTADFLYEVPIDKEKGRFSFLIGGGVGFGVVFGNLYRDQAYPKTGNTADPNDPNTWSKCTGAAPAPVTPGSGVPYCDGGNQHYFANGKDYSEPSWANHGSKPLIFPWLSIPQLSFRYKPIKQLQTRFDTGFSTSGFFFGLSAGYGL